MLNIYLAESICLVISFRDPSIGFFERLSALLESYFGEKLLFSIYIRRGGKKLGQFRILKGKRLLRRHRRSVQMRKAPFQQQHASRQGILPYVLIRTGSDLKVEASLDFTKRPLPCFTTF